MTDNIFKRFKLNPNITFSYANSLVTKLDFNLSAAGFYGNELTKIAILSSLKITSGMCVLLLQKNNNISTLK